VYSKTHLFYNIFSSSAAAEVWPPCIIKFSAASQLALGELYIVIFTYLFTYLYGVVGGRSG